MQAPHRVFVGWDAREEIAYDVCEFSLNRRASEPVHITPLVQQQLRDQGLYWRALDPLASTEFTYTRFLVPYLADYKGWALFCDCDFLWRGDVVELFQIAALDSAQSQAVLCVQHDYRPPEKVKMDGVPQTLYPRKNWSSLMLLNCGHPAMRALDLEAVNTQTGAWLHRFAWLDDQQIGALSEDWNWLEGWSDQAIDPKAVHFTRGGPWFPGYHNVAYAPEWVRKLEDLCRSIRR